MPKAARKSGQRREQIFNPITTERRQVGMKRLSCSMEGVEMLTSTNIGGICNDCDAETQRCGF